MDFAQWLATAVWGMQTGDDNVGFVLVPAGLQKVGAATSEWFSLSFRPPRPLGQLVRLLSEGDNHIRVNIVDLAVAGSFAYPNQVVGVAHALSARKE